ncbi:hypothetical protein VXT17_07265 [Escherichia coli]|uniref:hypothetical protein n=1 Tax=Escherichia coli TaxID=562 RepID=UPI002E19BA48|nr:hypothetical protein [Escherichia coli]
MNKSIFEAGLNCASGGISGEHCFYSGRMTREVDGQQTQSVIYSLLNKTPDASPDSASNTSVICTILSLLNLVKPVQTRRETHT